jgi:hypothetical protein
VGALNNSKVITIAGMICESYNVLCASSPFSVYYADVYLQVIGIISSLYVVIIS